MPHGRLRSVRVRDALPTAKLGGRTERVLRLQQDTRSSAVRQLVGSSVILRAKAGSPVKIDGRPESGTKIIFEDDRIGSFVALSVQLSNSSRPRGGEEGEKSRNDIIITKRMDERSAHAMRAATEGRSFPHVTIDFMGFQIILKDALITSYSVSEKGEDQIETRSLNGEHVLSK